MTIFEYVMVLTSILIGLGIAELLGGIIRILRSGFKENIFIPQILWAIFIFLYILNIWWSRWDLRDIMDWNFVQLLLSLTGPIILYILAGLIFPLNKPAKAHFYKQRIVFYSLLMIQFAISLSHELIIERTSIFSFATLFIAIMLGMSTWAIMSKKDYVHTIVSIVCLSLVTTFIILTTYILYT